MSEAPIEVVRRLVDAFNAWDTDAVLALCAPDVVVYENPAFPDASVYRGHEGVRAMLARWDEAFAEWHTEVSDLQADGDRVLLMGSYEGVGRLTGAAVQIPSQRALYVVRDGRIVFAQLGGELE